MKSPHLQLVGPTRDIWRVRSEYKWVVPENMPYLQHRITDWLTDLIRHHTPKCLFGYPTNAPCITSDWSEAYTNKTIFLFLNPLLWGLFRLKASKTSRGRSVIERCHGIATGYGVDGRGVGVRVPVGARFFFSPRRPGRFWSPNSLLSSGYGGLLPRGKAEGTSACPLTSNQRRGQEYVYINYSTRLHGVALN
jgi:hypothetical protein